MFSSFREDCEQYIVDYVKENAIYDDKFIKYNEVAMCSLEYVILVDNLKVKDIFKHNGNGLTKIYSSILVMWSSNLVIFRTSSFCCYEHKHLFYLNYAVKKYRGGRERKG